MNIADYNLAVEDWADALYRYTLKSIGNAMSAQDVVQDCFERLWIHHTNVDSLKVKSWLFTTAHHAMVDRIRKHKREQLVESEKLPENYIEQESHDLQEIINQAVDRLPDIQKSVVLLRDYEGYSYREIGEITGLTESQVKVYIYRSRIFLKNYLGAIDAVL
jgi:RNA polymerase sigma-70 factor (ECF subfamily)